MMPEKELGRDPVATQAPGLIAGFLYPLWLGIVFVLAGVGCAGAARVVTDMRTFLALCSAGWFGLCYVYYFMIQYRLTRVLEDEPGWWGSYTPAGIVWRQFVPIYGIYVLYQWTKEVGGYIEWRLGRSFHGGPLTFVGLLVGACLLGGRLRWEVAGQIIVFASFLFFYRALGVALLLPAPGERMPLRGTLGMV